MSKETLLKKAYNDAIVNDIVRRGDDETARLIIKNEMIEYAKKNNVEVSEEEIMEYILAESKKLKDSCADFTIQTKMMK